MLVWSRLYGAMKVWLWMGGGGWGAGVAESSVRFFVQDWASTTGTTTNSSFYNTLFKQVYIPNNAESPAATIFIFNDVASITSSPGCLCTINRAPMHARVYFKYSIYYVNTLRTVPLVSSLSRYSEGRLSNPCKRKLTSKCTRRSMVSRSKIKILPHWIKWQKTVH